MKLTPIKKHIVPAFTNWMLENDPRVNVAFFLDHPETVVKPVPPHSVTESLTLPLSTGEGIQQVTARALTLNIHFEAIRNFVYDDKGMSFQCRMQGTVTEVYIPYEAVFSVSTPNSGLRQEFPFDMEFLLGEESRPSAQEQAPAVSEVKEEVKPPRDRSFLRVIK